MASPAKPLPFDEFAYKLQSAFDEAAAGNDVTVERNGQLFRLAPVHRGGRRKTRTHLASDDALWSIVGIGASGDPANDVASDKYKYLAEAVATQGQEQAETHSRSDTSE